MKRTRQELYDEFAQKMLANVRNTERHQALIDEYETQARAHVPSDSDNDPDYDVKVILKDNPLYAMAVASRNSNRDRAIMYGVAAQAMKL